jgi:outer membrane beta-barrel protein
LLCLGTPSLGLRAAHAAEAPTAAEAPGADNDTSDDGDAAASPAVPAVAPVPGGQESELPAGGDACIDENVRADLLSKRQRRSARERLFQKTNRHEIGAFGGYYVSDLFDHSFIAGGSYAYHMTEDLSIEAAGSYTRLSSSAATSLERNFALLQGKSRHAWLAEADLVWVPAYAKLRAGGSIVHFDLYLEAGAGIVDSALSSDIAANGGFGIKMFLGRATAVRLDVRDRFYRQQLLSRVLWVNDVSTTLGISLFLPLGE